MVDSLSRTRRSENMRRIRDKNTLPEMGVRRLVHGMGHRYRLHVPGLPGKPDLVFRNSKKVIFVHGCFWHQHSKCREGRVPASREDYWRPKLQGNVERDRLYLKQLKQMGWKVLVIWECELANAGKVAGKIRRFLD